MALKNAYSKIPINRIFELITSALVQHGARQIVWEYGNDGQVYGVTFVVPYQDKQLSIKLPARISNVSRVLQEQGFKPDFEQEYRTAWRNVLDWIEAQMAMIDTGMVKLIEVFLAYMTDGSGTTYFEVLEKKQFTLPAATS